MSETRKNHVRRSQITISDAARCVAIGVSTLVLVVVAMTACGGNVTESAEEPQATMPEAVARVAAEAQPIRMLERDELDLILHKVVSSAAGSSVLAGLALNNCGVVRDTGTVNADTSISIARELDCADGRAELVAFIPGGGEVWALAFRETTTGQIAIATENEMSVIDPSATETCEPTSPELGCTHQGLALSRCFVCQKVAAFLIKQAAFAVVGAPSCGAMAAGACAAAALTGPGYFLCVGIGWAACAGVISLVAKMPANNACVVAGYCP